MKGEGKVPLRLAVTLRPLSQVMAPSTTNGYASQNVELAVPPLFAVVTFPCELEPFIVPFMWAYVQTHSISLNQKLSFFNDATNVARVDAFVSLSGRDMMRINDRQSDFKQFFSFGRTELEKILELQDLVIPTRETRILLDFWHRQCSNDVVETGGDSSHLKLSEIFRYLLGSTLPLWQSIFIKKRTYDVHKPRVSAWSLAPLGQGRDQNITYFNRLDEPLRLKIERALIGIMSSDSEARDLFFDPITEDLAPSYNCAVPLGMSFSTVMQRLRVHIGYKSCYYRSVEAVLADIGWIHECCLLYNSPESEVVDVATNVIDNTKEILTHEIRDHYKYMKSALSKDCERLVVLLQPRLWLNNFGRKSENGLIDRDWLEEKCPNADETVDPNVQPFQSKVKEIPFPFQVGDKIVYSRDLHNRFITGHCSSLEYDQCHIPSTDYAVESNTLDSINDWEKGVIVSTHVVFPKILTRDEKDSFGASAMLQCLGVKLGSDKCPSILFWRPCLLNTSNRDSHAPCPGCSLMSSFVKLAPNECEPPDLNTETSHQMQSILRCINLLKHKCLNYIDPDKIDPSLVQSTVKLVPKAVSAKFGKNALPAYDKFLGKPVTQPFGNEQLHHGTRGTTLKPKDDDDAIAALVHAGFLPRWINAARGGTTDEDLLRKLDMILPVTKLSLEYISLRIKSGFYRHTAAIENDVIEAYLTTIYSHLFEAVTRKKSAISVRRLSQLVSNKKLDDSDISAEEQGYVSRIQRIRSLYGTALLAVMDITRTQRVFGLSKSTPPKRSFSEPENDHNAARQKLEHLVMVLRRENSISAANVVETSDKMPHATLKITCPKLVKTEHLIARQGGKLLKVNIMCRGQELSNLGLLPKSERNESFTISFGPEDYENNEELARFLFSRSSRRGPCARCQVYNRTMVACRVLRKHTNLDCDWSTLVNGGIDFVDDLIKILDPNGAPARPVENAQEEETQREKIQPALNVRTSTGIVESAEVNDPDPSEFFQLATTTVAQATDLADAAKSYSECPLRLSKNFIESNFPIDKSDGHFLYCVLCGLSGDLLCCDGCPNVVHAKCISLVNLPEGDWFCEKCTAKKSGKEISHISSSNESKFLSIYSYDENGSAIFNEDKLDSVVSQLEILRRSRPTQKTKENTIEITNNAEISADATSKNKENNAVALDESNVNTGSDDAKNKSKDIGAGTVTEVNEVRTASGPKKSEVSGSSAVVTENEKIDVSKNNQIIILPIVERSMRTRHPISVSQNSLRPSIMKRRRIERAAV